MKQQDFNLKIKIIPVGLEFSNYSRFRQVLTVVYGKPIEVSEFFDHTKRVLKEPLMNLEQDFQ